MLIIQILSKLGIKLKYLTILFHFYENLHFYFGRFFCIFNLYSAALVDVNNTCPLSAIAFKNILSPHHRPGKLPGHAHILCLHISIFLSKVYHVPLFVFCFAFPLHNPPSLFKFNHNMDLVYHTEVQQIIHFQKS